MTIEKGHQSNTNLFDPLEHPPSGIRWPLKEMLTSLKVRAKAVADWAQENGLTVTISFVTKYDPYRRENAHEYMLVLSWRPKEKPAEDAA